MRREGGEHEKEVVNKMECKKEADQAENVIGSWIEKEDDCTDIQHHLWTQTVIARNREGEIKTDGGGRDGDFYHVRGRE